MKDLYQCSRILPTLYNTSKLKDNNLICHREVEKGTKIE